MAFTPNYTYEQFEEAARKAGLLGSFSQEDLNLARQHPDAGMSILSSKKDWMEATTPEGQALANAAANNIRSSYGGYTANDSGRGYYADALLKRQINGQLETMGQQKPFEYGNTAQYQAALKALTERKPFSYDAQTDPVYAAYKKEYLREGQRATANALAQASAATGGRPSSYAATAASQAGDYYASQLSDKIPELYQQAYQRYLNDQKLQQAAYQALAADRSQAMNEYQAEQTRLQAYLSALQGQDATDYARAQTVLDRQRQAELDELARQQYADALAQQAYENERSAQEYADNQEYRLWQRWQTEQQYADQKAQQEYENAYQLALAAAGYGDYSGLNNLGITPSYTEMLNAALAQSGRVVPIGYGSGGGGSSGGSRGGSRGGGGKKRTTEAEEPVQGADTPVDLNSVLALGLGSISAAKLQELINTGQVEEYIEDGKRRYRWIPKAVEEPFQQIQIGAKRNQQNQQNQKKSWAENLADALAGKLGIR